MTPQRRLHLANLARERAAFYRAVRAAHSANGTLLSRTPKRRSVAWCRAHAQALKPHIPKLREKADREWARRRQLAAVRAAGTGPGVKAALQFYYDRPHNCIAQAVAILPEPRSRTIFAPPTPPIVTNTEVPSPQDGETCPNCGAPASVLFESAAGVKCMACKQIFERGLLR